MKFILFALVVALSFTFMAERTMCQRGKAVHQGILDILQSVLIDPDYLTLSDQEKLNVLCEILSILDELHTNRIEMDKKD